MQSVESFCNVALHEQDAESAVISRATFSGLMSVQVQFETLCDQRGWEETEDTLQLVRHHLSF